MLNSLRRRLIHLYYCLAPSRAVIRKILYLDPSLSQIYNLSPSDIKTLLSIPRINASSLYRNLHNESLLELIKQHEKQYTIITIVDEAYPPMLKTIKDAPILLYATGKNELLQTKQSLSVIGTRKPSHEAIHKIKYIVKPLIDLNWVIVSGMAVGIDSYAHQLTLANKGNTIAVLGSGFEHVYPRQNLHLFQRIQQHGLVLSEYPPETPPRPYHFPERNRIISGLSFGTLVIEATEKSGTLITVDHALDQGREVYAVPGSPLIEQTRGCHKIIQEGAKLVAQATHITEDWEKQWGNWEFLREHP